MASSRRPAPDASDDGEMTSGKRVCAAPIHEQVARCLAAAMFGVPDECVDGPAGAQSKAPAMLVATEQLHTPWRHQVP